MTGIMSHTKAIAFRRLNAEYVLYVSGFLLLTFESCYSQFDVENRKGTLIIYCKIFRSVSYNFTRRQRASPQKSFTARPSGGIQGFQERGGGLCRKFFSGRFQARTRPERRGMVVLIKYLYGCQNGHCIPLQVD